jgi:hypothetical protein
MHEHKDDDVKVKVGKYMSYILRHNPENLEIDKYGFVDLDRLLEKLNEWFKIDKNACMHLFTLLGIIKTAAIGETPYSLLIIFYLLQNHVRLKCGV